MKQNKLLMFEMTLEVAQEFYKRCIKRHAETQEEKTAILIELAEEGKMKSVIETSRTPDQVAKDMSKNFGRVLYVKPKRKKKMKLKINRLTYSPTSTLGEMWIDDTFFCYTLERPDTSVVNSGAPWCIPKGNYDVTPRWSAHNKMEVLGINHVSGRTDIEIHPANYPTQLLGCIAVGDKQSQDYVGDSRGTFAKLMAKTKDQTLTLEIA